MESIGLRLSWLLLCIDHKLPSVLQLGHVPMHIEPLAVEHNPKRPL